MAVLRADSHWPTTNLPLDVVMSFGCLPRFALAHVIDASMSPVEYLHESGSRKVHNVENLLLRESLDVIGASL